MKPVFEGEIINVLCVDNGLIIAYICERDEEQKTVSVAYKMVAFDSGKVTNVPKSLYELSKFGPNYTAVAKMVKNHITCQAVILPNGKVLTLETDGDANLIDTSGETVWSGKIEYRGAAPSSIAVSNRSVWTCFKEKSALMRMNLITMREELRIGGGSASPFANPVHLFIENDDIYVCNAGSNEILKVNLNSYVTEVYKTFESRPRQFIKNDGYEFAVLDNGIYLLD